MRLKKLAKILSVCLFTRDVAATVTTGATASQISTWDTATSTADKAIDNNPNPDYFAGSCMNTNSPG